MTEQVSHASIEMLAPAHWLDYDVLNVHRVDLRLVLPHLRPGPCTRLARILESARYDRIILNVGSSELQLSDDELTEIASALEHRFHGLLNSRPPEEDDD